MASFLHCRRILKQWKLLVYLKGLISSLLLVIFHWMIRLLMNVASLSIRIVKVWIFVLLTYGFYSYHCFWAIWYWISFVLCFIAFWCGWELVTFSPYPLAKAPDVSNAGRHLSAAEFHSVLQNAGELWFPFWFAFILLAMFILVCYILFSKFGGGVLLYREWMNGNGMSWAILHMFLREAWR